MSTHDHTTDLPRSTADTVAVKHAVISEAEALRLDAALTEDAEVFLTAPAKLPALFDAERDAFTAALTAIVDRDREAELPYVVSDWVTGRVITLLSDLGVEPLSVGEGPVELQAYMNARRWLSANPESLAHIDGFTPFLGDVGTVEALHLASVTATRGDRVLFLPNLPNSHRL